MDFCGKATCLKTCCVKRISPLLASIGTFPLPSWFGRGLASSAISKSCLCKTKGVKSPIVTEPALLVHWRMRGYARSHGQGWAVFLIHVFKICISNTKYYFVICILLRWWKCLRILYQNTSVLCIFVFSKYCKILSIKHRHDVYISIYKARNLSKSAFCKHNGNRTGTRNRRVCCSVVLVRCCLSSCSVVVFSLGSPYQQQG